jgi:nucleotide-binding universal stress UspA family protein
LHIGPKDELIPYDPFVGAILGDTMGEVSIENGKDTIATIKKYAENNNVSMLIMIRRKKSFLQKLLIVGNTADELGKTNTPLMILPE